MTVKNKRPAATPAASPALPSQTVVIVVNTLDELVAAVVKKHIGKVRPDFLDWVADEMTPRLERLALTRFGALDDHRSISAQNVRRWVMQTCLSALEDRIKRADTLHGYNGHIDILLDNRGSIPAPSPSISD